MITESALREKVMTAIQNDDNLITLIDMMPLNAEAKDAIWMVLAVAYSAGMIAGISEVTERAK